jgi:hypothetical protein
VRSPVGFGAAGVGGVESLAEFVERTCHGPLGLPLARAGYMPASPNSLTHGRDLAQGTGQPAKRPEAPAEQELAFARTQLSTIPRTGRFSPAQTTPTTHPPSIGRRRPQRSVSSDRPRDRVAFGVPVSTHPAQVVKRASFRRPDQAPPHSTVSDFPIG